MKNIFLSVFLIAALLVNAQEKDNNNGIMLGAYIPQQAEGIPSTAKRMLVNKLGQIITKNGISDNVYNSRFIITPNITVISKDVMPTAPPRVALNLETTLYIGDGIGGNLFASQSVQLKGVGTNETKAYIAAIKRLNPKNPEIQNFIKEGKNKIIDYYNQNCQLIIKKASALESQNKFEEALALLTNVPEVSTCFNKVKSKIKVLFKKSIDRDCKVKLAEATSIWNASQDLEAANEAGALLAEVDPQSACYSQVKSLFNKIGARVKDLSDREWNYSLKVLDLEKSAIQAARDVGVAYGKGQPNTVNYNVRGWY